MSDQPGSGGEAPDLVRAARDGTLEAHLKQAKRDATEEAWGAMVEEAAEHHLAGRIDLTTAFAGEAGRRLNHASQKLVGDLLPRVSDKLADIVRLIETISARAGGDIPYYLIDPFGRWCEGDASRPMEALEAIRTGTVPKGLLRVTLSTGLKIDRARFLVAATDLAIGGDGEEREAACDVLGRFTEFDSDGEATAVTALQAALRASAGEGVVAPLRALLLKSLRGVEHAEIGLRALEEVARRPDAHVRQAVAGEIMFRTADASDELAAAAFGLLADTEEGEPATLDFIDQIVSANLAGRHSATARKLLDGLLGSGAADMRKLGSTRHSLVGAHSAELQPTVTRWLTSGALAHVVAVRELCMGADGDPITFELDFGDSALTPAQAERIGRWTCVVLTIFPEAATSVLVSLMRTGPKEAMPALRELLFDPILISYWTGPRAYLEEVLPSLPPRVAEAVNDAIAQLDRYKVGVDAAQDLPELRPSQHHRYLAQLKRHEEQQAIDRNARAGSVLGSLFPMSIMLFGDSAIYEMEVEPGNTVRQETQLASFEYSHELPRLEVIDPFGTWYQRERLLDGEDDA